jgi:hypothetical protein
MIEIIGRISGARATRIALVAVLSGGLAAAVLVPAAFTAKTASPPVNAAAPTISGTARQGQTLTASSGAWSGATPISFAYRWKRCDAAGASCANIVSATDATYVLVAADVTHTVRVEVTATNSDGTATSLSDPSGVVADLGNAPANTKQPDPSGTPQDGSTISVDNGTWSGTQPITFTHQWQRCTTANPVCTDISGATSQTYKIVAADVGLKLRANVTGTNAAGKGSASSNLTGVVQAKGSPPVNTGLPLIVGTPAVGATLTTSNGTWTGADDNGYSYAWNRCASNGTGCSSIPGATGNSYPVQAADAGKALRSKVTAKNSNGSTSATSVALPIPAGGSGSGCDQINVGGGKISVPVTCLTANPDHLLIDAVKYSPSPFGNPGGTFTIQVRVIKESSNQVVRGALVYVVPLPYAWANASPEVPTGTDGWVSIQIQTTKQLPRSGALVMQVRARGTGTGRVDILGGISTRRLVQLSLG